MITISKHYCNDCVDNCWFAHDQRTGQTVHVNDYAAYTTALQRAGFYYAGHVAGEQRYRESYRLASVTPLPLEWQIAADLHSI